jgi:hypothetical protein
LQSSSGRDCWSSLPFMPFCFGVLEPDSYFHTPGGSLWCSLFLQRSVTSKFLHGYHYPNVLDHLDGAQWFDLKRAAANTSLGSSVFQVWICSSCATSKSFYETIYGDMDRVSHVIATFFLSFLFPDVFP